MPFYCTQSFDYFNIIHLTINSIYNRRKQAVEDLAVKPVTQFPVEISNEDAFASFKNVRHVTIKKVIEGTVDEV